MTPELFENALQSALQDEDGSLRRVSNWPIERTFVYIDVSDFSKHPSGQEALIVNSIVGIVNDKTLWTTCYLPGPGEGPEAMMCIGDGYIFVFKKPLEATCFAANLAHFIELMVACKDLLVDFHFRMGAHVGPVYCFWDPGRKDWNYIGDGINGGNRVLAAVGKETDDVIYVSGEVREAIMQASVALGHESEIATQVLGCLLNRGRKADKHGYPWRVYELNHTALCKHTRPPRLRSRVEPTDTLEPVLWLPRSLPPTVGNPGDGR